jgi:hypothetical protein
MGDTFDRMQDSKEESLQMNRCKLVVEFFLKTLGNNTDEIAVMQKSFRWLHVLQPRSMTDSDMSGDEWAGRMQVIRQLVHSVDDKVDRVDKRISESTAAVDKRIAGVDKRISENTAATAAVDKRIGELQDILLSRLPATTAGQ